VIVTNTLAYYDTVTLTAVKYFVVLTPEETYKRRACVINSILFKLQIELIAALTIKRLVGDLRVMTEPYRNRLHPSKLVPNNQVLYFVVKCFPVTNTLAYYENS
jgi:hypothetical protein